MSYNALLTFLFQTKKKIIMDGDENIRKFLCQVTPESNSRMI